MNDFDTGFIPSHDSNWVRHNEWRWDRILELASTKDAAPSPPGDDQWIVNGYKFLTAMRAAKGDRRGQRVVAARWPALFSAFTLRIGANVITRDGVNSMIGQGIPWEQIGQEFGEPCITIEWYVKLWYSDKDPASGRPNTAKWHSLVQNPEALSPGFTSYDTGAFFLKLAYGFQPDTLHDVLEGRELTTEDAQTRFVSAYSSMVAHKALHAAANISVSPMNALGVLEHALNVQRTQRELDLQERAHGGAMSDILKYCVKGAKWFVMEHGVTPIEMHSAEPKMLPLPTTKLLPVAVDRSA